MQLAHQEKNPIPGMGGGGGGSLAGLNTSKAAMIDLSSNLSFRFLTLCVAFNDVIGACTHN